MPSAKSQQVVMHLFDAIRNNDRDRFLSFFTDESVFEDAARGAAVGHAAIWSALAGDAEAVERRLCQIAERPDGRVLAERLERYLVAGVWSERKVTGLLAVNGCKITQWSDSYQ